MLWKGHTLETLDDLMYRGIDRCATPEEAAAFMRLYRADTPTADADVGYISGYYGEPEMRRIWEWFGVEHPVFGRRVPSPAEAFAAGLAAGTAARYVQPAQTAETGG